MGELKALSRALCASLRRHTRCDPAFPHQVHLLAILFTRRKALGPCWTKVVAGFSARQVPLSHTAYHLFFCLSLLTKESHFTIARRVSSGRRHQELKELLEHTHEQMRTGGLKIAPCRCQGHWKEGRRPWGKTQIGEPPVNIRFNPTTKMGSKMGGECTYPKMGSHWF